jgi:hypothetical protein
MAGSKDGIGVVGWRKRRCPLIVSHAPQSGLALAADEPRPAATAILRIEALAADVAQKRSAWRRIDGTESTVRAIVPPRRLPARTERKPTAEFAEDMVVVAHDLIAESCAPCSGRSRPILFALSSPLRRVIC